MIVTHTVARQFALAAFHEQYKREATTPEVQCYQAVGGLETGYGTGWHGAGIGSNNEGAIQGVGPAGSFTYTDTHPNADGTNTPYSIAFRKYPNAVSGWQGLCQSVYVAFDRGARVLPAASRGDLLAFSTELHRAPCYYEGFGATDADRIAHHHNAVLLQIQAQCAELGEAMPEATPLPTITPALFLGCTGPAVIMWQKIVGATPDGSFGMVTATKTRAWQITHKLPPSGIVCQAELNAAGLGAT